MNILISNSVEAWCGKLDACDNPKEGPATVLSKSTCFDLTRSVVITARQVLFAYNIYKYAIPSTRHSRVMCNRIYIISKGIY
jgi:hypothetical protein